MTKVRRLVLCDSVTSGADWLRLLLVPDYDLVTPFQVDKHGSFHSNDLSTIHLRTRRSDYHLVKDVPAHFKVPAFGDVHHLAVSPNNELLSPGFILQVHLENGKIDTHYEYTHSQYVGTVRGDEDSHVAISNHGGNLVRTRHHASSRILTTGSF